MSLAMIQRIAISSCRGKVDIDAYRRILLPSLSVLRERTAVTEAGSSVCHACVIHKRPFHESTILRELERINPKESGISVTDDISTFQMNKRPARRSRVVIKDDKTPKSNAWSVKALTTAEEYDLETLAYGLLDQQLYIPDKISTSTNQQTHQTHQLLSAAGSCRNALSSCIIPTRQNKQ
ncbi:PREDICTED: uncharacterized protein LOC105454280 isoform X1 [Wasmannia auropunctata]|uniref:uncharacterized protein LOC105454280 isoform X1 n=1 Tax=Wasmannia auropunctata TaxID=64793 RepID=UPI0005ED5F0F|nr:PREDICTED: uncharacterized protein LOC105454280 isoform X1 [Wasmannia auropunctata]